MKRLNRVSAGALVLLFVMLVAYWMAARPVLGIGMLYRGEFLFMPRWQLNCDYDQLRCNVGYLAPITITYEDDLGELVGGCQARTSHGNDLPCSTMLWEAWHGGIKNRPVIVVSGLTPAPWQLSRMRLETSVVDLLSLRGPLLWPILGWLSLWIGVNYGFHLHKLQQGWGNKGMRARMLSFAVGGFIAWIAWMPIYFVLGATRFLFGW